MGNQEKGTRNQGFRGLIAWQKADALASATYRAVGPAGGTDRWLVSQVVRAAISVPANIAEGYGRGTLGDYLRFIDIARGSLAELEYFLEREGLMSTSAATQLTEMQREVARVLHGLWKSLKEITRDGTWDRTGIVSDDGPATDAGVLSDAKTINP